MININNDILINSQLFLGIGVSELERLMHCLSAQAKKYAKDEFVMISGDAVNQIGLVIKGRVKIIKEDMDGNSVILTELSSSEIFGEVFACAGVTQSPVTIAAMENAEILFINFKKIIEICPSACPFHTRLMENMLKMIAVKTLLLNQKIEILSKRTIRKKLIYFFDAYSDKGKKFTVPYNREEMAHYLCVDRSALSGELCKMRDEKLIRFNKNNFEILYK